MQKKNSKLIILMLAIIVIISAMPISSLAAPLQKNTSLSAVSSTNSISLSWKKTKGADGYTVYRYFTTTKKSRKIKDTTKLSYKVNSLSPAKTYSYYIKSYKDSKNGRTYSKASNIVKLSTKPKAITSLKLNQKKKYSISISWNKVKNAQGYLINYSTSKDFKSNANAILTNETKKTVHNLEANTTYYVKVYAYRTVNSKRYYSNPSKIIRVKTNKKNSTTAQTTVQESTQSGSKEPTTIHKATTTTTTTTTTTSADTTTTTTTQKETTTVCATDADGWITKSY